MERFRKVGIQDLAHKGGVWTVSTSGSSNRKSVGDFITGGCDGKLRTWSIQSERGVDGEGDGVDGEGGPLVGVREFAGHSLAVVSVAVAQEGCCGVSVSLDGSMRVWNLENAEGESKTIQQLNVAEMWGVAICKGGERAVTGGVNGSLKVVDTVHGVVDETYSTGDGGGGGSRREHAMVMSVGLSEGGGEIVAGLHDGGVKVLDVETGRVVGGKMGRHGGAVRSVRFLEGEVGRVVSGGDDGLVQVYDVRSGHVTGCWRGHEGMVFAVDGSRDGRYLVSGGSDRCVMVWDRGSGEVVEKFKGHGESVWGVGYACGGEYVVSVSDDGGIGVLDCRNADVVV